MAVFLHISTELKWLQLKRELFVCYTFMSVSSPTKTNSGQYGHILGFLLASVSHGATGIMDAAASDHIAHAMQHVKLVELSANLQQLLI